MAHLLTLNNTEINFCDSVMYLGIDIGCKLRFEDYADKIISKASQRMYIVKNFLYLRFRPLVCMLIDRFVVSLLSLSQNTFQCLEKLESWLDILNMPLDLAAKPRQQRDGVQMVLQMVPIFPPALS